MLHWVLAVLLSFLTVLLLTACSLHCVFLVVVYRTVHYSADLGSCCVLSNTEAKESFQGQVTILKYFAHYMEENLMDVSELQSVLTAFSSQCR